MKLNKIVIFRVVFKGCVVGCFVRDVPVRVLALAKNDLAPNFIELHNNGSGRFSLGFCFGLHFCFEASCETYWCFFVSFLCRPILIWVVVSNIAAHLVCPTNSDKWFQIFFYVHPYLGK